MGTADNPNIYTITAEVNVPEQVLADSPDSKRPLLSPTPQKSGKLAKRVLRPRLPPDLRPFKEQVLNPEGGKDARLPPLPEGE